MTVALAPPRRRTHKVDMNAYLASRAKFIDGEWTYSRGQLAYIRLLFASRRPEWGLGEQVTDLTAWDDVGIKISNTKVAKNKAPTLSLTLSSHAQCRREVHGRIEVLNTCPWAGACSAVCVLKHGRGTFPKVQAARNWRTSLLYDYPVRFMTALRAEIERAAKRTNGEPFLARLNVNSDLPWHLIPELFEGVPIQAYDYTKDPGVLDGDGWVIPGKYRKIYSWNETSNLDDVLHFLWRGGSVAMVTNRKKGQPVNPYYMLKAPNHRFKAPIRVVDGDQSDNRFDTPPGVIVDLYAKGNARNRKTAFVQEVY